MKVYIVCNDIPERVFKKKRDAEKYLSDNGYEQRDGFYCLNGESDIEFDLMINEREVIQ